MNPNYFLYLIRQGQTLTMKSDFLIPEFNFTDIMSTLSSSEWTFVGLSLFWTGDQDSYIIWAYIYQNQTNVEEGGCKTGTSITTPFLSQYSTNEYILGEGLDGYIKSIYTTYTPHDPFTFSLFKDTFGQTRLNCFETDFNEDPFYINPGWGNGYVLPSETTEECDDKGLASGDGWSNTWTIESPYSWANVGVAGISSCSISWGNGKV